MQSSLKPLPLTQLFFWVFIALVCIILLEQYTNLDTFIQTFFFNTTTKTWCISANEHASLYTLFFYKGFKLFLIISGVLLLFFLVFRWKHLCIYTKVAIIEYLLALIFVPLCIASLKKITNVYCPNQLALYNGLLPYDRLFESFVRSSSLPVGRCFPAGHATSGFFLFILYFCCFTLKKTRYRFLGLFIGLVAGWTTGIYQMLRGEHFFSHTATTMLLAWVICAVIYTCCTQATAFVLLKNNNLAKKQQTNLS